MAYTKSPKLNIKFLIFEGLQPKSKAKFTLRFNAQGGLSGILKESGRKSFKSNYPTPPRESEVRKYFEGEKIGKEVYEKRILPLLADRSSLTYLHELTYLHR